MTAAEFIKSLEVPTSAEEMDDDSGDQADPSNSPTGDYQSE